MLDLASVCMHLSCQVHPLATHLQPHVPALLLPVPLGGQELCMLVQLQAPGVLQLPQHCGRLGRDASTLHSQNTCAAQPPLSFSSQRASAHLLLSSTHNILGMSAPPTHPPEGPSSAPWRAQTCSSGS